MALNEIVAHKWEHIKQRRHQILKQKDSLRPSSKNFLQGLKKIKPAFICEVKFSSPSQGTIRKGPSALDVAKIYEPFANAISVLADEKYFGGSYEDVQSVSQNVSCPVLCKDVVVSPLQVYEARFFGADAVLLMLSVLSDDAYVECARVASSLGMDFITEVHDKDELDRAKTLGANIIGINNRNLKTLKTDLGVGVNLLDHIDEGACVIMESGLFNRQQIRRFYPKASGFLIGTALMKSERIDLTLRQMLFGRVKICGLTNKDDAHLAYENGAYYGGLNFAPVSKRFVDIKQARQIKDGILLSWGGIFVNQSINEVTNIANSLKLEFIQLHGDEDENYIEDLRKNISSGTEIWKAIRVKDEVSIPPMLKPDRILLDCFDETDLGGTGRSFDWEAVVKSCDAPNYILAGGINPGNVEKASAFNFYAIDIASGVENNDPRKKSPEKIKKLFYNLRSCTL